jgi:hypothetical protein
MFHGNVSVQAPILGVSFQSSLSHSGDTQISLAATKAQIRIERLMNEE